MFFFVSLIIIAIVVGCMGTALVAYGMHTDQKYDPDFKLLDEKFPRDS